MSLTNSYIAGIAAALLAALLAIWQGKRKRRLNDPDWLAREE